MLNFNKKDMKKIIKNIFILSLSFAGLSSCEDKLELGPQGSIDSALAFETIDDLQFGLNGSYARFRPENDITFNSVFADNCKIGFDSGGQQVNLYNWTLDPTSGASGSIWSSNYIMINNVNRLLDGALNIVPNDVEETEIYNSILGQAYALRAHAHLNLLSYFATDYQNETLSVIRADVALGVGEVLDRVANSEVYDLINSDLDRATALIPSSQVSNDLITLDFVTGTRARLALIKGDNADAITYAQELIDKYPLASAAEYQLMFNDVVDTEMILKLTRVPGDLIGGIWYFTGSDGPFLEASNSLYNTYDVSDVRRNVVFNFTGANGGPSDPANNIHLINKYAGSASPYLNDAKAMRVSEMYLIKAEAQALSNDLVGASSTLDEVRLARTGSVNGDSYPTTKDAAIAVLEERRKELAFEGHRYLDLKRLKSVTNVGINRDAIDCVGGGSCLLPVNDFRFTLPIPQSEINAQPSLQQNPDY
jgi:hypothetical protein